MEEEIGKRERGSWKGEERGVISKKVELEECDFRFSAEISRGAVSLIG